MLNPYKLSSLAVFSILALLLTSFASGSDIITDNVRPAIDAVSVKLYNKAPQKRYEYIGLVQSSSGAGWSEEDSQNYAVVELKKKAANLGANGVVVIGIKFKGAVNIKDVMESDAPWEKPTKFMAIKGYAIFVYDE